MVPSAGEKQHCVKKEKLISSVLYVPGFAGGMTVVHVGTHTDPGPSRDLSGGHTMAEIKSPVLTANTPHLQCVIAV